MLFLNFIFTKYDIKVYSPQLTNMRIIILIIMSDYYDNNKNMPCKSRINTPKILYQEAFWLSKDGKKKVSSND